VAGPMLAHRASNDALVLAEHLAKGANAVPDGRNRVIPQAIFTDPEIASVGLSEKKAKEEGLDVIVGRFPYAALGKALGMNEPEGFFQVVAEAASHRLIGAQHSSLRQPLQCRMAFRWRQSPIACMPTQPCPRD